MSNCLHARSDVRAFVGDELGDLLRLSFHAIVSGSVRGVGDIPGEKSQPHIADGQSSQQLTLVLPSIAQSICDKAVFVFHVGSFRVAMIDRPKPVAG